MVEAEAVAAPTTMDSPIQCTASSHSQSHHHRMDNNTYVRGSNIGLPEVAALDWMASVTDFINSEPQPVGCDSQLCRWTMYERE